jgi:hypothetical protein
MAVIVAVIVAVAVIAPVIVAALGVSRKPDPTQWVKVPT